MKRKEQVLGEASKNTIDMLDILLSDIRNLLANNKFTNYFYLYKVSDVFILESVDNTEGFKLMYASTQNIKELEYIDDEKQLSITSEYELPNLIEDTFLAIERANLVPEKKKIKFNSASKTDKGYETNTGVWLEGVAVINETDNVETEDLLNVILKLPDEDTQELTFPRSVFYREIGKLICANKNPGEIGYTVEDSNKISGGARYEYIRTGYSAGYVKRKVFNMGHMIPVNTECKRYLRQLDVKRGTYCFYYMELKNNKLHVEYGDLAENEVSRYGKNTCDYPLDMYWIKYYEKINKGYIDYTSVLDGREYKVEVDTEEDSVKYPSEAYAELYNYLKKAVKSVVSKNIPNGIRITERLVVEANKQFSKLEKAKSVRTFNKELEEFVRLVPRKITHNIKGIYASNPEDIPKIIEREEQLLLAMQSVITMAENPDKTKKIAKKEVFINPLEADITYPTAEEEEWVKSHIRKRIDGKVHKIFKVYKPDQAKRYETYKEKNKITNQRHLWHGSATSNWSSIILQNLKCKPNCGVQHGSMFGPGIYFADDPNKSLKYTSLEGSYWEHGRSKYGVLGMYRVATGNEEITYNSHHYTKSELKRLGKDSVYAKKGQDLMNNEFIVYDDDASSIEYIVLFKKK